MRISPRLLTAAMLLTLWAWPSAQQRPQPEAAAAISGTGLLPVYGADVTFDAAGGVEAFAKAWTSVAPLGFGVARFTVDVRDGAKAAQHVAALAVWAADQQLKIVPVLVGATEGESIPAEFAGQVGALVTSVHQSLSAMQPSRAQAYSQILAFQIERGLNDAIGHGGMTRETALLRLLQAAGAIRQAEQALMAGTVLNNPEPPARRKQDKPDTAKGWSTVRDFAANGVPYGVFLHQRHYGGAFRQLLDATGTARGDLLEDAVENLARDHKIPYIRTGAHNQADIAKQFNLTVRPAPDFVFYDNSNTLRALLECKQANDGGTARDKARRFAALREEATRLGGIPLIAMLSGLGWRRTRDALGPVVRDCDGRVFSLETLPELLTVAPFPQLAGTASQP